MVEAVRLDLQLTDHGDSLHYTRQGLEFPNRFFSLCFCYGCINSQRGDTEGVPVEFCVQSRFHRMTPRVAKNVSRRSAKKFSAWRPFDCYSDVERI